MHTIRILTLLFLTLTFPLSAIADSRSWTVLVTVAPHKYFVERIAGDTVKTHTLLPLGANAHTFEPTPKQILATSNADLWFKIGEPFEGHTLAALKSHNSRLQAIDLRKGLDLITGQQQCIHQQQCDGADLHYWLTPKSAKIQAKTIATALIKQYPENAEKYTQQLNAFLDELDNLDQQMAIILNPLSNRTILVSHPAYAYLARDYQLKQISVEYEGKDPSPQQLTKILERAKELGVKTVFIQPQFSNKGAKIVAELLKANVVSMDPYMEDYPKMMIEIATKISKQ